MIREFDDEFVRDFIAQQVFIRACDGGEHSDEFYQIKAAQALKAAAIFVEMRRRWDRSTTSLPA